MDLFKKKNKSKTTNTKRATNSQLSTTESKKTNQANNQNRNRIIDRDITWRIISWAGKRGEWGKRCRG